MKKRWTEARWREHNRAHSEDLLERRTRWKERKREARRENLTTGRVASEPRFAAPENLHRSPRQFVAPDVLSLIEAPEESLSFFRRLQDHVKQRDVYVDLSNVKVITPDAIALLIAIVRLLAVRDLQVSGNYPNEASATETIRESGFNDYLKTSMAPPSAKKGAIVRQDLLQQSKKADGTYARKLIDFAEADEASRLRLKVAYAHLVECMGNTHQHAGQPPGAQTWWASVFRDSRRSCDCFTFVDMGVGIFNSVELSIRLKLYNFTGFRRQKILQELLEGKIPSSTGKSYRGRGLPSIYRSCKDGRVKRLVIITNNVYADTERNDFRALSHDFKGVILYWEVPHEHS